MQPEMDPDSVERERARRKMRAEQVQRRRLALVVVALGLIVLVVALAIGLSGGDGTTTTTASTDGTETTLGSGNYGAELTGADSVPPVKTAAAGNLILTYDAEKNEMSFVLEITHALTNPTGATIYEGRAGTEGAAVYTLYIADQAEVGSPSGVLAEGIINEADLIGPLQGGTMADLIQLIEDGNAYVSVANKTHPVDAIRGPIN